SQTSSAFVKQVGKWRMGEHVNVLPDNYFVASALAKHNKSIKTERPLPVELDYGYHFDSVLLGDFLRLKSVESGVLHDVKTITSVKSTNGNIISLHTDDGEVVTAD
ncbi:tryptophan 7-halogenase, partial [Pseudoalteromonas piscicida]